MECQCWSCSLVEEVLSVFCTIQFFMFFAKTLMSPTLTLLYHHMINLYHHMMNIIYLVTEWEFHFPFMPTWRMISQKKFHIACARGSHSILKQNFSNQNIISFNPWINQILLYVVDSTNLQCTHMSLRYFRSCFCCASAFMRSLI